MGNFTERSRISDFLHQKVNKLGQNHQCTYKSTEFALHQREKNLAHETNPRNPSDREKRDVASISVIYLC